jgi:polyphenol oxidase
MRKDEVPGPEVRIIAEVCRVGAPDRWVHPGWEARLPWLVQGVTARERAGGPSDFALFTDDPPGDARSRWAALAGSLGFSSIVHARQVHGRNVVAHDAARGHGLEIGRDADGHASATPGVLMAVTVADCVPIYLVDPDREAAAILHAGWRGVVAGILERGLEVLKTRFGTDPGDLLVHLGPAICGTCYEVGPEVLRNLGLPDPGTPAPVDLRGLLGSRATASGVDPVRLTRSAHCTLCGDSPFFSHRRGDRERQVGYLGIRPRGTERASEAKSFNGLTPVP